MICNEKRRVCDQPHELVSLMPSAGLGITIYSAFAATPALGVAVLLGLTALTFALTRLRRNVGSGAHIPQ